MGLAALYSLFDREDDGEDGPRLGGERQAGPEGPRLGGPTFLPLPDGEPTQHSGFLKVRNVVSGIPFRTVDYCMYHDDRFSHQARKRTAIWTNTDWFPERPLCRENCRGCVGGRHTDLAQRGPSRTNPTSRHTLEELYAIPPLLCEDILRWTQRVWPRSEGRLEQVAVN